MSDEDDLESSPPPSTAPASATPAPEPRTAPVPTARRSTAPSTPTAASASTGAHRLGDPLVDDFFVPEDSAPPVSLKALVSKTAG